jgi:hypothetical protein
MAQDTPRGDSVTLDEKIKAAVTEIQTVVLENEHLVGYQMMEAVLRRHLTEPWLCAPTEPGWWWHEYHGGGVYPVNVTDLKLARHPGRFQRMIGPTR